MMSVKIEQLHVNELQNVEIRQENMKKQKHNGDLSQDSVLMAQLQQARTS